jgi:hypothetical protein
MVTDSQKFEWEAQGKHRWLTASSTAPSGLRRKSHWDLVKWRSLVATLASEVSSGQLAPAGVRGGGAQRGNESHKVSGLNRDSLARHRASISAVHLRTLGWNVPDRPTEVEFTPFSEAKLSRNRKTEPPLIPRSQCARSLSAGATRSRPHFGGLEKARGKGYLSRLAECAALAGFVMTIPHGMAVQAKAETSRKMLDAIIEQVLISWPSANLTVKGDGYAVVLTIVSEPCNWRERPSLPLRTEARETTTMQNWC